MSLRKSRLTSISEAVDQVADGSTVGIGGAVTAGHPMALVRALADAGARDLTVVAPAAGIEVDLLVACGCVSRVATCYVGVEGTAPVGPVFRKAVEKGEIEVIDFDEAHLVMGLRAAGQGLPFLPWRGGVGTSFPELNPELVEFEDPIRGEPLIAVPALELDFAFVYAETADQYGNAQPVGGGHMDSLLGAAAERVFIQVDQVVENSTIRERPELTTFWRDAQVIPAEFGTHPYSSSRMVADESHLTQFVRAAKSQDGELDEYLERFVRDVDHPEYLERVGSAEIQELLI